MNATLVKGKIVFCEYFTDYEGVLEAGALGAVFQDLGNKDFQFSYPLPFSTLNVNDGRMIINYLNTTEYFPISFYNIGLTLIPPL